MRGKLVAAGMMLMIAMLFITGCTAPSPASVNAKHGNVTGLSCLSCHRR